MPSGIPGCPELTASTASIERARMQLASCSISDTGGAKFIGGNLLAKCKVSGISGKAKPGFRHRHAYKQQSHGALCNGGVTPTGCNALVLPGFARSLQDQPPGHQFR